MTPRDDRAPCLDPETKALLERLGTGGAFGAGFDIQVFRGVFEAMAPLMWDPSAIKVAATRQLVFPGAAGPLEARAYFPRLGAKLPALLYFHGGGFTSGSLATADAMCRFLAVEADCLVVSTEYRLAPEHRHPAGFEDCLAAWRWAVATVESLGGDPARLAVGGDASGATYAAAVCLAIRGGGAQPVLQFLLGPATDWAAADEVKQRNLRIGPVPPEVYAMLETLIFARAEDRSDWRCSPLLADSHAGLPPAFILTAQYDFLEPECRRYAAALEAAGVDVTIQCWPGTIHNFFSFADLSIGRLAMANAAAVLRRTLHPSL